MELKHSFSILASRYSLVFKVLIYFILITAICAAVLISIMTPQMDPLFYALEDANVFPKFGQILSQMFMQNITYSEGMIQLSNNYQTLMTIINDNSGPLLTFYVLVSIVFFIYRLFTSMTSVPIAASINNYMNTSVHNKFLSSMTENFWVSMKYSFFATLINHFFNMALGIAVYKIIMAMVWTWGFFSFTLGMLILVLILSIKYALLLGWIPLIVVEKKKVLPALLSSIKQCKNWFKYGFLCAFMLYLSSIAFGILLSVLTFGIMLPIIMVSIMVILRIIELVNYYGFYKRRYYIDHSTIISPREELF